MRVLPSDRDIFATSSLNIKETLQSFSFAGHTDTELRAQQIAEPEHAILLGLKAMTSRPRGVDREVTCFRLLLAFWMFR